MRAQGSSRDTTSPIWSARIRVVDIRPLDYQRTDDAVYQRNTGRVPSIYFRRTHRQKGESRGKFNLFIAGSKRLPPSSSSTSLPAHEVVRGIPGTRVYLFLCPSSPHRPSVSLSLSFVVTPRRANQILVSLFLLRLLRIGRHCSTNEAVVRKEGVALSAMRHN